MGQLNSVLKTMTTSNEENRVPYDESSNNGLIMGEKFIPEELLSEILCLVDHKSLTKCQLVCKCWNVLIQSYIWRKKAERTLGHSLPLDDNAPWTMYYFLCDKKPFCKNLIKNHSGHQKLNEWSIYNNGGNGWKVETPPIGIQELPDDPVFDKKQKKKCFVTSFNKCWKYQVIDLIAEGFTEYLLDNLKPTIKVSEWYGCRWDCEAQYCCAIKLFPEKCENIEDSEFVLHEYEFSKVLEGEDTNKWFKFEHELKNYPKGVRKIVFAHGGQDRRFWAGNYGSKMAGACVQLEIPEFHNTKNETMDSQNLNQPMIDLI